MDFNTGTGGGGDSPSRPSGPPRRTSGVATGGEFSYTDPVQSFVATVRSIVTQPVAFFSGMARQGDFVNPLVFALICWEIAAILGGILAIFGALAGIGSRGVGGAFGGLLASIVITPIIGVIALLIAAGILHLLVILIVRPVDSGFETTFRVVSYTSVYQLVSWVPILGQIAGFIIWIILAIFGIREAHSTTTGKAALVVLIPVAVFAFIALVLAILVGAFIFSVLSGQ